MRQIDLHDIARLEFEELPAVKSCMQTFAGRDRLVHGLGNLLECTQILRRHWLFEPTWAELLELAGDLDCRAGIEAPVHLYKNLEISPHSVPYSLHQGDRPQ